MAFLSTLSLRRATVTVLGIQHRVGISIHALLAESDGISLTLIIGFSGFLSTLSLRRATAAIGKPTLEIAYFYPRSPCGERQQVTFWQDIDERISIHALLAESDHETYVVMEATKIISIHALLAESDHANRYYVGLHLISIHALLAESDRAYPLYGGIRANFYPRSPCGERPVFQF